jgi:hypothetical protein
LRVGAALLPKQQIHMKRPPLLRGNLSLTPDLYAVLATQTLVTVHGLVDSLYLEELAKKTFRGVEQRALQGVDTGGRVSGYRRVPICGPKATGQPRKVNHPRREARNRSKPGCDGMSNFRALFHGVLNEANRARPEQRGHRFTPAAKRESVAELVPFLGAPYSSQSALQRRRELGPHGLYVSSAGKRTGSRSQI